MLVGKERCDVFNCCSSFLNSGRSFLGCKELSIGFRSLDHLYLTHNYK